MSEIPQVQAPQGKPKMNKSKQRRLIRRIVKIALWVIVLGAVAGGGYWYYQQQQVKAASANTIDYTRATVMSGSLDKVIYGTGSIQALNQPTVLAQTEGTLVDLRADVGDQVAQGQILAVLQNTDLDEEIQQLEYDLWNLDSTITSTSPGTEVTSIKAPTAGRVMKLYAQPGDDALAVYRRLGSVAILSTDGRMKVEFEVAAGLSLAYGDAVTVVGEGFTQEGTVTDVFMQGTRAVATMLNDALPMDAQVTVHTPDGQAAGTGTLAINKPLAVSAFGGTVKAVRVKEGQEVTRKQELFTLEDSPITLKVENLRLQRETAAQSLADAKAKRENLIVRAPEAGVVASVSPAVGDDIASGDAICSILVGEDMVLTVAVDELDVVSVKAGQRVSISVDALPQLALTGTVEKIAPVGSGESGVATYNVRLSFDAAGTGVRPGMNASGQIQVDHVDNALYIPVEALMTMADGKYVLVADGSTGQQTTTYPQGNFQQDATGAQGGTPPSGAQGDFSNLTQEQRQALRQQMQQGDSTGSNQTRSNRNTQSNATVSTPITGSLRQVSVGLTNDDYVQILSGLSAGEVVLYQQSSSSSSNSSFMIRQGGGNTMAVPGMMF